MLTLSKRHNYPPVANINCAYIFRGTGHPLWYRFISADNERKYPKSSIMKRNGLGHLNLKSSVFGIFDDFVANPGIANAVANRIVKILDPPNEKAQDVARFLDEVAKWRETPPRPPTVTPSAPSRSNTVSSNSDLKLHYIELHAQIFVVTSTSKILFSIRPPKFPTFRVCVKNLGF